MIDVLKKILAGLFGTRTTVFSRNAECYKILGIKPGASLEAVKAAYKEQSERLNVDLESFSHDSRLKQRMEELIKELDDAYQKVTDEIKNPSIPCVEK